MENETGVVITGFGTISSIDDAGRQGFFSAFRRIQEAPESCVREPLQRIDDLGAETAIPENQLRRMDRISQIAMLASFAGIRNSGLSISAENADRIGVLFNTCFGPLSSTEEYLREFLKKGPKYASPKTFPLTVAGVFTGLTTMNLKAHGSNSTLSGTNPVAYGVDLIRQGFDDAVLVGGCDELNDQLIAWFESEGLLGRSEFRSGGPKQFLLGEGAATLVLEKSECASRRGATAMAEILGYAAESSGSSRAYEIDEESICSVIARALDHSGVTADQIDLVGAGSNGCQPLHDNEQAAFVEIFAERWPLPVVNAKTVIGETLGASGVFSALVAAGSLCDEVHTPGVTVQHRGRHAIALSYEFGGNLDCIVLKSTA